MKICRGVIRVSRGGRRTALRVILTLVGVLAGWTVASYAFMYFIGNGVTSDYATGYSIIVWLVVLGVFWLVAFKVNLPE
jgi:hypothetical protein